MEIETEIETIKHGRQTIRLSQFRDGTCRTEILIDGKVRIQFDTHPNGGTQFWKEGSAVEFDFDG